MSNFTRSFASRSAAGGAGAARSARTVRVASAVALVGLSLAAFTGCTGSSQAPTAAPTVTVTVTPSPTTTPSPTSSPSPTTSASGSPVTTACSSLVFDSTITAIGSDFATDPGFEIASGTVNTFSTIAMLDGKLCSWKSASSGSTIVVAVAKPSSADLATNEARVKAAGATSTSEFSGSSGDRGYVASADGAPEFDLFTASGYWIAVSSVVFDSASSADSIFANVIQSLPKG